ncbi:glycoside hydrolase family 16 protein [Nocardioides sp. SYSU DS0651]|uniref:glycoside hydrolase family 16 protein n=1 Tax=Nocardioides sp. SYSU DS0651 TaxID=3415955 RepID=UPI003F4BCF65
MKRLLSAVVLLLGCLVATIATTAPGPFTGPATAAGPKGDACGPRVAKGKGFWSCTLAESFSGSSLDPQVWTGITQPGSGELCALARPETISLTSGVLRLSAIRTTDTAQCPVRADGTRGSYAGAWLSTYYRWGQQYGRFEARVRVQAASDPGLHEAFWLWPDVRYTADTPWPASGEIDIAETFSSHPDLAVPFLHYNADDNGGSVPGLNTAWNCYAPRGQWHTYTLEWTADRLTVLVNGQTCLVNTDGAASFRKPFIINLTQTLGGGHNLYDGRVPLPATMEVDYVKVWK